MGYDNKISLGADSVSKYKQYGEKVLAESRETLKKAGITVPVGQKENDKNEPVKGWSIEHADAQSDAPAELPTEVPEYDNEKAVDSSVVKENGAKAIHSKNSKINARSCSITDTFHPMNDTYNAMILRNSSLSNKGTLSESEKGNHNDINDFVDVMDDIEDAGKQHIDKLTETYPESGKLDGEVYAVYDRSKSKSTTTVKANISNSWQNKSKTFVISGSASFGYEKTKNFGNQDNIVSTDNLTKSGAESNSAGANESVDNEADNDTVLPKNNLPENKIEKSGNVSINLRFDKKHFIYGAGVNSNFTADGVQIHDQNVTVMHKSTGLTGDFTRRTTVTKDEYTGEAVVRSKNKLKISLVSRDENTDNPFGVSVDSAISKDAAQDLSKDLAEKSSDEITNDDTTTQALPEKFIEKDSINPEAKNFESEVAEDAKALKSKVKDGSGFDLDFEYDDINCGATAQYGINLINSPEKQTRLTLVPVLGAYDHTPAEDEQSESLKMTLGTVAEFKKHYPNGNRLEADLSLVANRVVTQGSRPSDTRYAVFSGSFINPKKKFSVGVNAGVMGHSEMSLQYAEVIANYRTKNTTLGLQAGITNQNLKALGQKDTNYQVGVKCTIDLDYKTKK